MEKRMKLYKFISGSEVKKNELVSVDLNELRTGKILKGSYLLRYNGPTGDIYFYTDNMAWSYWKRNLEATYGYYYSEFVKELEAEFKAHHMKSTAFLNFWKFSFFNAHCMVLRHFPDSRIVLHLIRGIKVKEDAGQNNI